MKYMRCKLILNGTIPDKNNIPEQIICERDVKSLEETFTAKSSIARTQ